MIDWIRVCTTAELLPGEYKTVWNENTAILVFNYDGTFYALEDRCSHEDVELSGGCFNQNDASIECVLHGSKFDIRNGQPLNPPAYTPVATFQVKVTNSVLWIRNNH